MNYAQKLTNYAIPVIVAICSAVVACYARYNHIHIQCMGMARYGHSLVGRPGLWKPFITTLTLSSLRARVRAITNSRQDETKRHSG